MSFRDNEHYAYLALLELLVVGVFVAVGWYALALGWAGIALADLLTYEWSENPNRYGWVGDNPYLAGAAINGLVMVYLVGYLITLLLGLL